MWDNLGQIREATQSVRQRWSGQPRLGIILGSGLGGLATRIRAELTLGFDEIPHFPPATALGHRGRLVCGRLMGLPVMAMEGRIHRYEGYSMAQVTLPVRMMSAFGIETLLVSNASGGLNPSFQSGDVVVIEDHIDLMFGNPLIGPNDDSLGPRFPDMSQPYDGQLIDLALQISRQQNFTAYRGVYAGLTGPNYETRAEYRWLRRMGADLVGMSTVPEVIVARHAGMRVLALSAVTNICRPDQLTPTTAEGVVAAAESTEPKMRDIVSGVVQAIRAEGD